MRCNNKGQMAATEFIVIIVLLLLCIWMGWYIVKKKTDISIYQADSKPTVVDVQPHFGGCASVGVERWKDALKSNSTVNSAK